MKSSVFTKQCELNSALVWSGFIQMTPIALFVLVFGTAFGLAAIQAGLHADWVLAMSIFVFAGASQFAVLDLWGPEISVITLSITVFAINARHLLMGASLYPWLSQMSYVRRYGLMVLASDANWAMTMQSLARGESGFGLLLGGGLALWLFWVLGTFFGVYFGGFIQDPSRYGLDMVMGCFLLTMAIAGPKNIRILAIWVASGIAALLSYYYFKNNSHVIIGALAGGIVGCVWTEEFNEA